MMLPPPQLDHLNKVDPLLTCEVLRFVDHLKPDLVLLRRMTTLFWHLLPLDMLHP